MEMLAYPQNYLKAIQHLHVGPNENLVKFKILEQTIFTASKWDLLTLTTSALCFSKT